MTQEAKRLLKDYVDILHPRWRDLFDMHIVADAWTNVRNSLLRARMAGEL